MIARALAAAQVGGWSAVPLADIHRHALWVAHLQSLLPPFQRVYTNNPLTRQLFEEARFAVESPPLIERGRLEGAQIRTLLANDGAWAERVPPTVAAYLAEIHAPARLRALRPTEPG